MKSRSLAVPLAAALIGGAVVALAVGAFGVGRTTVTTIVNAPSAPLPGAVVSEGNAIYFFFLATLNYLLQRGAAIHRIK